MKKNKKMILIVAIFNMFDGVAYIRRKGTFFPCSILNPLLFWICSSNMSVQTHMPPKNDFSPFPFSLNEDYYSKLAI